MPEINERFKDMPPEKTVETIQNILKSVGIELKEEWNDSGIENCHSVHVYVEGAYPFFTNGKGVTRALARASAYGEFIEQLQCGLFLYKFQSITRDPEMDLQRFAPDGKFMTLQEVIENGDWMDHLIASYGGGLTRKKLAQLCKNFSCADDDRIWTLPFYSLFEDKLVYLPAGFMLQLYAANGGCAGNTREEAWIHALSEIMERRCTIDVLTGGKAAAPIPEEVIRRYDAPARIMDAVRDSGLYDIRLFDFSMGNGYPVIAARIINKKTHEYLVDVAADPVLEIAIDRALTECFQGRTLQSFPIGNNGYFLEEAEGMPAAHNLLNQIEHANGLFSVNFFTEEAACGKTCSEFPPRDQMNNKELLAFLLDIYRGLGKPVYVRNFSFLGFHSYQFIIPGFSETRTHHLSGPFSEYAMGDAVQKTLRNAAAASDADLTMMLLFHNRIRTAHSRRDNFRGLAGLPLDSEYNVRLLYTTLAYGAYRLGRYAQAADYLSTVLRDTGIRPEDKAYFACVKRYIRLKMAGTADEQLRILLGKFYEKAQVEALYRNLDSGKTPFDDYLLCCDRSRCGECRYQAQCAYEQSRGILGRLGKLYGQFHDGQSPELLKI